MKHLNYLLASMITILSCARQPIYNDPVPKHDALELTSTFVQEKRGINVWTPPMYAQSNDSLPVLYMPDGGIQEDFPHIANTLAELIAQKKIPPHILVGIENTERRRDLTGASQVKTDEQYNIPMDDGAKNFRQFITDELVPDINRRYRTTTRRGIIGESLAGLFVVETFLLQPAAFDFYIAMDPSLWWNGHYLVNNADALLNNLPNRDTKLWFAGSNAEDIQTHTRQLANVLATKRAKNLTWMYSPEPKEAHNTIFRATKEKAMIWAMGGE